MPPFKQPCHGLPFYDESYSPKYSGLLLSALPLLVGLSVFLGLSHVLVDHDLPNVNLLFAAKTMPGIKLPW